MVINTPFGQSRIVGIKLPFMYISDTNKRVRDFSLEYSAGPDEKRHRHDIDEPVPMDVVEDEPDHTLVAFSFSHGSYVERGKMRRTAFLTDSDKQSRVQIDIDNYNAASETVFKLPDNITLYQYTVPTSVSTNVQAFDVMDTVMEKGTIDKPADVNLLYMNMTTKEYCIFTSVGIKSIFKPTQSVNNLLLEYDYSLDRTGIVVCKKADAQSSTGMFLTPIFSGYIDSSRVPPEQIAHEHDEPMKLTYSSLNQLVHYLSNTYPHANIELHQLSCKVDNFGSDLRNYHATQASPNVNAGVAEVTDMFTVFAKIDDSSYETLTRENFNTLQVNGFELPKRPVTEEELIANGFKKVTATTLKQAVRKRVEQKISSLYNSTQ
jgi:hypothetical protein